MGWLPLRIRRILLILRMLCLSERVWPPLSGTMTTVPGVAIGGGVCELDRKRGWIWDSLGVTCCVNDARCAWIVRIEAGLELLVLCLVRGGSRMPNGIPGLGLLLVVGLAGMVSRKRVCGAGGDDDSNTVCRFWGSTADVSQESNPSSVERDPISRAAARSREAGRRDDRWLTGRRRVLDVTGRNIAWEKDDRIDVMVSAVERPPLDPGGVGGSNEAPRTLPETGLVSW